jgi:ABC-type uncharacterized transport system involved in gliding motility auxiliary subunit
MNPFHRFRNSLNTTALALLAIATVVAANLLATPLRGLRVDLTEDQVYSLSGGTRQMLQELQRPVELKFFQSRGAADMPVQLKQYAERVADLLREYDSFGGKNVQLTVVHPEPLSDEEEWARKYGLQAGNTGNYGADSFYLGVVAVSGSRESVLPFLTPADEGRLEYNLSRAIHEVTREKPLQIGVFSSLPIFGEPMNPMFMMQSMQRPTPPWLVIQQMRQMFGLTQIESLEENLPEGLDVLMLVHPKDLSEQALYRIDQHVVRGGKLIVLVDPLCFTEQLNAPQQQRMMGMGFSSDLPTLFPHWGLTYDAGMALADLKLAAEQTAARGGLRHPLWLLARADSLNQDEIPTQDLEVVQIGMAGAFSVEAKDGITAYPLISASDENALVSAMMAGQADVATLLKGVIPAATPRQIATRLYGTFTSAFEKAPEGLDAAAHVAKGEKPSQVIAMADADWIYDQMVAQQFEMMGQTVLQPIGDNLSLLLNLVEQSGGGSALVQLRGRGRYERPFTVVNEMLRKAETASRAEIDGLQGELAEAQRRVQQIAQSADEGQELALNQAMRDEQAALEQKIFETNRRLRDIERERRREVDALKFRFQLANILAVPLLMGLLGLGRGLMRRRRSNAKAA